MSVLLINFLYIAYLITVCFDLCSTCVHCILFIYLLFTEDGDPCLLDTDEADTEVIDLTDPEVFLLVYKWYLSPEKLIDCLVE